MKAQRIILIAGVIIVHLACTSNYNRQETTGKAIRNNTTQLTNDTGKFHVNKKNWEDLKSELLHQQALDDSINKASGIEHPIEQPGMRAEPGVDTSIRKYNLRDDSNVGWLLDHSDDPLEDSIIKADPEAAMSTRILIYYDITDDNKEEAIIGAMSFYSGTAGLDVFKIITIDNAGKLKELFLPESKSPKYWLGNRGKMNFGVRDKKIVEYFPVYKESDANCCPSLGTRYFTYKWNKTGFVLESVNYEE